MICVLSPAKALDFETPALHPFVTTPDFTKDSALLIKALKKLSLEQVSDLMDLSPKLAQLNMERYKAWSPQHTEQNSKAALLAFNGDVYEGLAASTLSAKDLAWAQNHLAVLSGLYGVLRPLDALQPYRLEMGSTLATSRGRHLYEFWGDRLTKWLNAQLENSGSAVLVNLASQEYFKAVSPKALKAEIIECVFQDWKATPEGGAFKIISFYAKRARGLMARFAITHRIVKPQDLKDFNVDGYRYSEEASNAQTFVFRRQVEC
jgi:uncharacterized protein